MAAADKSHLVTGNSPDTFKMPKESAHDLARVDIPQFDGVVKAARHEQLLRLL